METTFEILKYSNWVVEPPSFSKKIKIQQDLSNVSCKYSMHLIKTLRQWVSRITLVLGGSLLLQRASSFNLKNELQ
jgi:hypothetical protein